MQPDATMRLFVNTSSTYQTILGFGTGFTDSAGYVTSTLSLRLQDTLMRSYFGADGACWCIRLYFVCSAGLQYTFARVPIASCDFSPLAYSYDDVDGDLTLEHFALPHEDLDYKVSRTHVSKHKHDQIPYLQMAQRIMADRPLRAYACPWSAPGWMKDTGRMVRRGALKGPQGGEIYHTYAAYFVKCGSNQQ
jgi:glucosylceramidase